MYIEIHCRPNNCIYFVYKYMYNPFLESRKLLYRQIEASTCYLPYLSLFYIKLYPAHIEFPDNNFDDSVLSHVFHPFSPLTV